jgi:hypothetical protein
MNYPRYAYVECPLHVVLPQWIVDLFVIKIGNRRLCLARKVCEQSRLINKYSVSIKTAHKERRSDCIYEAVYLHGAFDTPIVFASWLVSEKDQIIPCTKDVFEKKAMEYPNDFVL